MFAARKFPQRRRSKKRALRRLPTRFAQYVYEMDNSSASTLRDMDKAAACIAHGKLFNAGQICVSPDYALVPASKVADFANAMAEAARTGHPYQTRLDPPPADPRWQTPYSGLYWQIDGPGEGGTAAPVRRRPKQCVPASAGQR